MISKVLQSGRNSAGYKPVPHDKDIEMNGTVAEAKDKMIGAKQGSDKQDPKKLSFFGLMRILTPYFWPASGTDGALVNRIRSTSTWIVVVGSKTTNIFSPFYLSAATNSLISGDIAAAIRSMAAFIVLKLCSGFMKELQGVLYIKVKQQAAIELQELTFSHLHNLSLNWHLSKKTGSVMRSMDRGVDAANNIVTNLFLYLIPVIGESLAVIILFFVRYSQWQLGVAVVAGVVSYAAATFALVEWRKKYRASTNKHDNDFHDKANDSIVNYETVKYFTGEEYEITRFKNSVIKYQQSSSVTQLSVSALNTSQAFLMQGTMLACMIIAGRAVVQGKMSIGSWIAVQSWVSNVFAPLNWLGSIYSSIIQSFIDITNLSELLFQAPDLVDVPNATDIPIPRHFSGASSGVSVEFRNVFFHYPEQPIEKGLKDLSIIVRPGTTTAIVGHTGAGKTTISRLLFRFYDPDVGAVLINGRDIKSHSQKSVRRAVGIVPQDTVLFNDTILHNISYGRLDASFEEVLQASEAAQIKAFVESLPDKWQTVVGERGDDALLYSAVTYSPVLAEHMMATGRAEAEWR